MCSCHFTSSDYDRALICNIILFFVIWLNWSLLKRSTLFGSFCSQNFMLQTKMDVCFQIESCSQVNCFVLSRNHFSCVWVYNFGRLSVKVFTNTCALLCRSRDLIQLSFGRNVKLWRILQVLGL